MVPSLSHFLPLTSFQKELWLGNAMLPDAHPGIFTGGNFILQGVPDPNLVHQAVQHLLHRVPLLTATLRQHDCDLPEICFGAYPEPDFQYLDLRQSEQPLAAAKAFVLEFSEKPYIHPNGCLANFALLRLDATTSWFLIRICHLVADGLSVIGHLQAIIESYDALCAGQPLSDEVLNWETHVLDDQRYRASSRGNSDVAFWQEYLKSMPDDRIFPPKPGCSDTFDRLTIKTDVPLSKGTTATLRKLAEGHRTSVVNVYHALHALVLAKVYGKQTIATTLTMGFGERRDITRAQGYRVNTPPLIVHVAQEDDFSDLLTQVKQQSAALFRRSRTPYQNGFRGEGQTASSHAMATVVNYIPRPPGGDGDFSVVSYTPLVSQYDPMLFGVYILECASTDLILSIHHSLNHFSADDVRAYVKRIEHVLFAVADEASETSIAQISALPELEIQTLVRWAHGAESNFYHGTIPDMFARQVVLTPDYPAVVDEFGGSKSYAQLQKRANGIAGWLTESGIGHGDVVAVIATRHLALAETVLGIMTVGAVYLPIDPEYPENRIKHMLRDSGAACLLALSADDDAMCPALASAICLPDDLSQMSAVTPTVTSADPAYLIYTSGSTGTPKGVLVPHRGFVNMIQGQIAAFAVTAKDNVLQFASPSFDASLSEMFMALLSGSCLYPVSRTLIDAPWELKAYMVEHRVSVVTFPPSYLALFQREAFPGLRVLITAGEPPIVADARFYAGQLTYYNAYGPTEASVCATLTQVAPDSEQPYISIGKPIANTQAYILNAQGWPVPAGVPGELYLAGVGLALGYLNQPELTAKAFGPAVFDPALRLYKTGDRGVWAEDGDIVLLGRSDDQVKIRGNRVELGEVAAHLDAHPAVAQSAVLDVVGQSGRTELVGFSVLDLAEVPTSSHEVLEWLREKVPAYMVPSRLILLDKMPVSPTGKVDKRALRDLASTSPSDAVKCPMESQDTISASPQVVALRRIFERILGHPVSNDNADFFADGGDSLKAMDLLQQVVKAFHRPMPLRHFMAHSSVADMAQWVTEEAPLNNVCSGPQEEWELTQGQLQLWVQSNTSGPSPQYNMPFGLEITGSAKEVESFVSGLCTAIAKQPQCCCVVSGDIDAPVFQSVAGFAVPVERVDLRNAGAPRQAAQALCDHHIHAPFDLTAAPPVRLLVLRLEDCRWQVVLNMHHIIGDGESIRVLLRNGLRVLQGQAIADMDRSVLIQFAAAERAYLAAPEHETDFAFWQQQLIPLPGRVNLDQNAHDLSGKRGDGEMIRVTVPRAAARALFRLATTAETTPLACFIGLVTRFLQIYTRQSDLAVAVPVSLRDAPELFAYAGYFVNTIVLRSPERVESLLDAARQTGQQLRTAMTASRYPFHTLSQVLGKERAAVRSSLVDVLVTQIDQGMMLGGLQDKSPLDLQVMDISLRAAKMDASFILITQTETEGEGALSKVEVGFEYDVSRISSAAAQRLVAALQDFLAIELEQTDFGRPWGPVLSPVTTSPAQLPQSFQPSEPPVSSQISTEVLVEAWHKLLGGKEPTWESDFFACGGDSIKAIQLVGHLRRRGVDTVTPAQIFATPTLGALAALLDREKDTQKDHAEALAPTVSGDLTCPDDKTVIPLLPIQQDMIRNHPDHWRKFHMVAPIRLGVDVDGERLQSAIGILPQRHQALRMAYTEEGARLLTSPPAPFWAELSVMEEVSQQEFFEQAAGLVFDSLVPEAGRMWGGVLIHQGTDRFFLLAGHHMVLDAVSLEVLVQEIQWYCQYGQWPPAPTVGLASWSLQLAKASADQSFPSPNHLSHWQDICAQPTSPLVGMLPDGEDRVAQRRLEVHCVAGVVPGDGLRVDVLATLAKALYRQGQIGAVAVTLEGHGRESIFANLDVSQSVGWFTATYPLPLSPSPDVAQSRQVLSDYFAELPHNGFEYGVAAQKAPEHLRYRPQITLNYLGQIAVSKETSGLTLLPELATPDVIPGLLHPEFVSDAPLDLMVSVSADNELRLSAYYAPECWADGWVQDLLSQWGTALSEWLACPLPLPESQVSELAKQVGCAIADIDAIATPSFAQQAMLYQYLLDRNGDDAASSLTYTQQIIFELQGDLDPTIMAQAWGWVINRHESLRTVFPCGENGEFVSLVLKHARTSVDSYDLSQLPEALQNQRKDALLMVQRQTPFQLACGPLLQMQLFGFGAGRYEMTWCNHHLLMDGWCIGILLRELFQTYADMTKGRRPHLPPAPSLAAYTQWRAGYDDLASEVYWQDALDGVSAMTPIMPEMPANFGLTTALETELRLSPADTSALQSVARQMAATVPHVIQGLWALLLGLENQCQDVVYGLVSSGRPAEVADIEHTVGLFIQTLPVRIVWQNQQSLEQLVMAVKEAAIARQNHEYLPLAQIQTLTVVEGPLFDHILVFENYPVDGIRHADAPEITAVSGFEQHPYGLSLSVVPGDEILFRFSGTACPRTQGILQQRMDHLAGQLRRLLHVVIEDESQQGTMKCSDLATALTTLSPPSCGTALIQPSTASPIQQMPLFTDTARPYPDQQSVAAVFAAVAAANPTQQACISAKGQVWTYEELDTVSGYIATGLKGVSCGEPVAFAMPRGPEAIAVMLGILKAGGCYVPLDDKAPLQRIREILRIAACKIIVIWPEQGEILSPELCAVYQSLSYTDLVSETSVYCFDPVSIDDVPAYVMFTSGSTGEPKGVAIPHKGITRLVCNSDFWNVQAGDRILQAGSLGFDAATLEVWGALLNAGTLCFIDQDHLLSTNGLRRMIADKHIRQMWLTSSLCNLIADVAPQTFAPLQRLFTGGEVLSPPHIQKIMQACPDLEIWNGYGPTENTTFTTVHHITAADLQCDSIPIGRPIANTRVYIVKEDDSLAAIGEWGEICAAGDGLALGYVGRADLTEKAFVHLPPPVDERVYRTGDIGCWLDNGTLVYQGRKDGQVKLRGFRIELREIEMALTEVPGVSQAAVVLSGEAEQRKLTAFVCGDSAAVSSSEILAAVGQTLPSYMVPEQLRWIEALPVNLNGKLDRPYLQRLAETPLLKTDTRSRLEETSLAAHVVASSTEDDLAMIYDEILGVTGATADADFFQLGGHSLKAMRLLARVNSQFKADLSLRDVMEHTTIASLARRIDGASHDRSHAVVILHVGEQPDYPLSSGQERLWFLQRMQPLSAAYSVPCAIRIPMLINPDILQGALHLLEQRHDALRARMPEDMRDGTLRQTLAPVGQLELVFRDMTSSTHAAQAVHEDIDQELQRPFVFGQDHSLVRLILYAESQETSVLLLNIHHIICDGWSGEIFLRDLYAAYQTILAGQTAPWAASAIRYVDYAAWQRAHLDSASARTSADYWQNHLSPLPSPIQLPTDFQRKGQRRYCGDVVRFSVDKVRASDLAGYVVACGGTVFSVLVALVNVFLYRHTGQTDMVVGVPTANRDQVQVQDLIGFFVNTIPLRTTINPDGDFKGLVQGVTKNLQDGLLHQHYPLDKIVERLDVPRDISRNPLFDVLVAFEGVEWTVPSSHVSWQAQSYDLPHRNSKLDLSFYFQELADGQLSVNLEYDTDLFTRATVDAMAARFSLLVDGVLAAHKSGMPIMLQSLTGLGPEERALVCDNFNATESNVNLDRVIDDCFRQQVAISNAAEALRVPDGNCLTYGALDARVAALAAYLRAEGVTAQSHVGVCFDRSPELMIAVFAVLRLGAIYVPFVPGLPATRIGHMVADLGQCLMLSAPDYAEVFIRLGLQVLSPDCQDLLVDADLDATAPASVLPTDVAYIIFTSGSTGRPKGVQIEHRSVLNRIGWMQKQFPLTAQDVILQKTPISFDVSIWELFWWSWTGASLAQLLPGEEKDPASMVAAVQRYGATVMHFVPSMLQAFLDYLEKHAESVPKLRSLRYVFASGEALTRPIVDRFNRLLHEVNQTELHNLYGPTEATVDVSWKSCSPTVARTTVPIGRPISNTRLYILDAAQQPVPIGVTGELFIGGVQVARGYVNRPDLTAERFVPDPFVAKPSAAHRMYRTGDLARWLPDGDVEYQGRCDDQVKIRGFRIELGEVEAALDGCLGVAQAVVRVGQVGNMPALEAFVLPVVGHRLCLADLRSQLADELPEYMLPSAFYMIEAIPLSLNGKADRKALQGERLIASENQTSAQSLTVNQRRIQTIWQQIIPEVGMVDIDQSFFEIGGTSLLLVRLLESLEKQWKDIFTLADLFVAVSIRLQAAHIDNVTSQSECPVAEDTTAVHLSSENMENAPIAIVGMAVRLADYDTLDGFWSDLMSGSDRADCLREDRQSQTEDMLRAIGVSGSLINFRRAAYLDDISGFDCKRFGIAPGDARKIDPEQRLFMDTALRALDDGGYGGTALQDANVGVFVGGSPSPTFKEAVARSFPEQLEQGYILNVPSGMATRIGYMKNWSGPAALVDTACSSSLKAMHDACQAMRRGECVMALAGGARVLLTPLQGSVRFAIESSSGLTRPFDAKADGVGAGEGAVVFLLKPLVQAEADGDAIRAVIRGSAVNQDGHSASISAPSPVAQAHVIRKAASVANLDLASLDFFEAHGTGTALGDPIEIDGLRRAFADFSGPKAAIGSVKSNFGHLDAAAGAIGVAKAVLCLQNGMFPRQPYFSTPNPKIDFAHAPVEVARDARLLSPAEQPWRGGVSAFGLSGINAHVILEQAPARALPDDAGDWHCIVLSAASSDGLSLYVAQMLAAISATPHVPVHAIAASLILGREHLPYRIGFATKDRDDLICQLLAWQLQPTLPQACGRETGTWAMAHLPTQAEAFAALDRYLKGDTPCWPEAIAAYRVHLPPTPMQRVQCWPQFVVPSQRQSCGFLDAPVRTPNGVVFRIPVLDTELWPVSEHRLNDRPTLVGMGTVALAFEAVTQVLPKGGLEIQNMSWFRPLVLENNASEEGTAAILTVQDNGKSYGIQFSASDRNGQWSQIAEARCQAMSLPSPDPWNVLALCKSLHAVDINARGAVDRGGDGDLSTAIAVSGRWNCKRAQWQSDDGTQVLAMLELPEAYVADLRQTGYHPAMLDVATSLALRESGFVPVSCRSINLHRPLQQRVYAHVVRHEAVFAETQVEMATSISKAFQADCTIMSEDGDVLVEFIDLVFTPFVKLQSQPQLHSLVWTEDPDLVAMPDVDFVADGTHVVMIGTEVQCQGLAAALTGMQCGHQLFPYDSQYPAPETVVSAIVDSGATHLVYYVSTHADNHWKWVEVLQGLCRAGLHTPLEVLVLGAGAVTGGPAVDSMVLPRQDVIPAAALAMGTVLAVAQEDPMLRARYVDLVDGVTVKQVVQEVLRPVEGGEAPVILAPGQRLVRAFSEPLPVEPERNTVIKPFTEGCVVFTGGLGGMALTLALDAVPALAGAIALIHRGEFAAADTWADLAEGDDPVQAFRASSLLKLQAKGVRFGLYSCDVTNVQALAATLQDIREDLGPIGGVVHTAGVAGNGFLLQKDRQSYEAVLAPKVIGVRHLHDLTRDDPLSFFVLASSRTALAGAAGQTDYTAANAYLDAFALWRHHQGLPALAIDWNTWDRVGMAAQWHVTTKTDAILLPEQAMSVLTAAVRSGLPQVVVTMSHEDLTPPKSQSTGPESLTAMNMGGVNLQPQYRVLQIVAETLGYDNVDMDDDFYDLGGDSISGMRVVNSISQALDRAVSLADLFAHSRLGDFVAAILGDSSAPRMEQISVAPKQETYPVGREQQSVLSAQLMAMDSTGYNLPHFFALPDDYDVAKLAEALTQLVARHESMRTVYVDINQDISWMRVEPPYPVILPQRQIPDISEAVVQTLIRPFDLQESRLFRAEVLQTQVGADVLFFDIHHSVADAHAVQILLMELLQLYSGGSLAPVELQLKDVAWHQRARETELMGPSRDYWLAQFDGPLPMLNLPTDRSRPPIHTFKGSTLSFSVPEVWVPEIRTLAQGQGTTSYNIALTLWNVVLGRLSDMRDLVIAAVVDGRDHKASANVTGMFSSLLPLRLRLNDQDSFADLLRRNHALHTEAMRHKAYSLGMLLADLQPPMTPDRTLLSEVSFSYMNFESAQMDRHGFTPFEVINPSCKGDLSIFASDVGTHLTFAIEYYTDVFDVERIQRMADAYLNLLRQVLEQGPEASLTQFTIAPAPNTGTPVAPAPVPTVTKVVTAKEQCEVTVLDAFRTHFSNPAICLDDSFLDLGGHSLLGLQIINRISDAYGVDLSIRDLMVAPSPRQFAQRLEAALPSRQLIDKQPDHPLGRYPLSHAQQRLYVLHNTDGGASAYNMQFVFRVKGGTEASYAVDACRFQAALVALCNRHETLRTVFAEDDGDLWQVVHDHVDMDFTEHELEMTEAEALALFRQDANHVFDLQKGPLFQVRLCHLSHETALVSLVMHHIIGDGWSMQVFLRELIALYDDLAVDLPPLAIQYRDYAVWQQHQDWQEEKRYWQQSLSGAPGRVNLPVDAPLCPDDLPVGVVQTILPEPLMTAVRLEAKRKGVFLATYMLSLFAVLLHKLTRQQDLVIGMGTAGRERTELEGLVGFFINILPIRIQVDDDASMDDLLAVVHDSMQEALKRQDYPFDMLVRELAPDRAANKEALINVMFEYQRYSDLHQLNVQPSDASGLCGELVDMSKDGTGPGAKYDLTLFVQDEPAGCRLKMEFDQHVLTRKTAEKWILYLQKFLGSAVDAGEEARRENS